MKEHELARVTDFRVISSIGNVLFPGPSDVRGLDLDSILSFENNQFAMFPGFESLPPYGQLLNKEFVLTLLIDEVEGVSDQDLEDQYFDIAELNQVIICYYK